MAIENILICGVQVPFIRGGAEFLNASLHEDLKRRGYSVDTVNLPFKWYPKEALISSALAWRMIDITESNGRKIDLVICTKYPSYLVKHPNKVVWLVHQHRQAYDLYGTAYTDFRDTDIDNRTREMIIEMDNRTLPEAKNIFTISENVRQRLKRFNNIEASVLYPPPKNMERLSCGEYKDYILYVGRLNRSKRIDMLIHAMRNVDPKVQCLIAGEGELRDELQSLILRNGLHRRIKFLGFVSDEDVVKLYANCFAVYYAPIDEDYGYATVEAFLCKKPVITTSDSGGVLEFVENEVSGYVTLPEPGQIAEKINKLFYNKNQCMEFGSNGYKRANDIRWDFVIKNLLSHL